MTMSDDPTPLSLPPHLPYPIKISRLIANTGDSIDRGTRLLEYTFTSDTSKRALAAKGANGNGTGSDGFVGRENDMVGSWESPVEGVLEKWGKVRLGERLEARAAR